jgi:hypothetical protein
VDWDASGSLGARVSVHLDSLYEAVRRVWLTLAAFRPDNGEVSGAVAGGRVVFPSRIAQAAPALESLE